jgi:hypothetical protein
MADKALWMHGRRSGEATGMPLTLGAGGSLLEESSFGPAFAARSDADCNRVAPGLRRTNTPITSVRLDQMESRALPFGKASSSACARHCGDEGISPIAALNGWLAESALSEVACVRRRE